MKLNKVLQEINRLNNCSAADGFFYGLHPLAKLLVTIAFVVTLMSLEKYQLVAVLCMGLYPLAGFYLSHLSLTACVSRIYPVLIMLSFVGIANPFFDKQLMSLGSWQLGAGYISFITLLLKGLWAVLTSYLLVATTSVERLCYALRLLHVPKLLVTQFLLTYRYLVLLLKEAANISEAYALRAPRQKGLNFKVWGSLVGQLLLRSMDRAENIYASVVLRGFRGEFYYGGTTTAWRSRDWLYLVAACLAFLLVKLVSMGKGSL